MVGKRSCLCGGKIATISSSDRQNTLLESTEDHELVYNFIKN